MHLGATQPGECLAELANVPLRINTFAMVFFFFLATLVYDRRRLLWNDVGVMLLPCMHGCCI